MFVVSSRVALPAVSQATRRTFSNWGINAVVDQTRTLAGWVDGGDAAAPVPTAPKWTLADLVNHVGATQRMVATLVGERLTDPSRAFASELLEVHGDRALFEHWIGHMDWVAD